jgi:hypothetical protein
MRKFLKVIFEIVVPPIILGWLFLKYPEMFDAIIPWIALTWLLYLTWDLLLERNAVKSFVRATLKRRGRMTWLYGFLIGGTVSALYLWTINRGIEALVSEHGRNGLSQESALSKRSDEGHEPEAPVGGPFKDDPNSPYFVSFGGNVIQVWPNSWADENGKTGILRSGKASLIEGYAKEGRVVIDAHLFAGGGSAVNVVGNQIEQNILNWDRNYDASAVEIVNELGIPMLQLIYKTPHQAEIYGVFQGTDGIYVATPRCRHQGPARYH